MRVGVRKKQGLVEQSTGISQGSKLSGSEGCDELKASSRHNKDPVHSHSVLNAEHGGEAHRRVAVQDAQQE